jgi:L-threonylcarbamoyladenylate synthase
LIIGASASTRCVPFGTDSLSEAAAIIASGGIVAVPTETVYGLAGDATSNRAVAAIYAAKGRPRFNPLIVHVRDLDHAREIGAFDADSTALAQSYWPGPLTLVVPLQPDARLDPGVTAGLPTVALRVPAHRAMRALLDATGKPLAAPSANASGTVSPTRAQHVLHSLGGRIPLVIDDGATQGGIESTIVMVSNGHVRLLRPGSVLIDEAVAGDGIRIEAPGQLEAHYAPLKPLRIDASTAHPDEWLIGFGGTPGDVTLSAIGDLAEAASRLFDLLHRADAAPLPRIAVAPVPHTGLGIAINDRLRRAAVGSGGRP